ncbi:MAG TPA: alpha/beta hydrolase [Pyrinomonadaceae bacterium]|nr:alpha/beta hydrolase [Pyrinomonadaceae bacterium]
MKKLLICTVFSILFSISNVSAQLSKSAEWTIETYVEYGFIEPNITYAKADGIELKLDVYRPKVKNPKPLPTLVFYHGGGWRGGSKEAYSLRVLPWLEKGWNVVNVEYRLTAIARAPAAVEDARCALRWVFENAEKYSFDTKKIVVSGQSAGGHIALMTGMATNEKSFDKNCKGAETNVAAIVNWFGITDVGDLLEGKNKTEFASNWIGKDRLDQTNLIKSVSPLTYVRTGLPPIITIHGNADPLVPYSHAIRLHEALTKAKVSNELFTVKNGDHGDFSKKDSIKAYAAIFKFLKKHKIQK